MDYRRVGWIREAFHIVVTYDPRRLGGFGADAEGEVGDHHAITVHL